MATDDKSARVKSAYERALERLDEDGIGRPRDEAFSPEKLEEIAEVRRKAEAKLAELEILHQGNLAPLVDPAKRQEEETNYLRERRRVESERDRKLERLRQGTQPD